jgi:hypothetical protein
VVAAPRPAPSASIAKSAQAPVLAPQAAVGHVTATPKPRLTPVPDLVSHASHHH